MVGAFEGPLRHHHMTDDMYSLVTVNGRNVGRGGMNVLRNASYESVLWKIKALEGA